MKLGRIDPFDKKEIVAYIGGDIRLFIMVRKECRLN
jgi:hypothetical protein